MNLFQLGKFTLSSGVPSLWKIECDALTLEDVETICVLIANSVPPFCSVHSVPTGGDRFAEILREYIDPNGTSHLIVDDVLTTGNSIGKVKSLLVGSRRCPPNSVIGAVVFARGYCPPWITPLFQLNPEVRV